MKRRSGSTIGDASTGKSINLLFTRSMSRHSQYFLRLHDFGGGNYKYSCAKEVFKAPTLKDYY